MTREWSGGKGTIMWYYLDYVHYTCKNVYTVFRHHRTQVIPYIFLDESS